MHRKNCLSLKMKLRERAHQVFGRERIITLKRKLLIHHRTPGSIMALGVSSVPGSRKSRLAVRVYKGRGNRTRALKLLKEEFGSKFDKYFKEEVDFATGITYRPQGIKLAPGVSAGHFELGAGTLGMIVEDATLHPGETERQRYILSNNHVLTNFEQASQGDIIIRPSFSDVKDSFKTIGFLHRWVPLATGTYDVALAKINLSVVDRIDAWNYPGSLDIKKSPITASQRTSVKQVAKYGRTTKLTIGTVTDSLVDVKVEYPGANGTRVIDFNTPQIEITNKKPHKPFSDKGDSGSLVVDLKTLKPFGLIFGGSKDNQGNFRTLAHFLPEVLARMNIRIVQETQPSQL